MAATVGGRPVIRIFDQKHCECGHRYCYYTTPIRSINSIQQAWPIEHWSMVILLDMTKFDDNMPHNKCSLHFIQYCTAQYEHPS